MLRSAMLRSSIRLRWLLVRLPLSRPRRLFSVSLTLEVPLACACLTAASAWVRDLNYTLLFGRSERAPIWKLSVTSFFLV